MLWLNQGMRPLIEEGNPVDYREKTIKTIIIRTLHNSIFLVLLVKKSPCTYSYSLICVPQS